ncbi:MAG: hypothetical protein NTX90_13615 [Alphaproteobacteria bacterium]|nr:hypothetical protein [Alphaproteobacteria bacterium]
MSNSNTELDRFRSDSFEPMSFRERGATVPFTTPLLLNARIRGASSGRGFEMVVANPSGGRGALILPWSSMPEICAPTLFDRHLWEGLASSDDVSPVGIRREAQRLAVQGLAGRGPAISAKDAQRRDQTGLRLMRSMLLESLITALEAPIVTAARSSAAEGESFLKRAERAFTRAAAIAKMPVATFTADLEALAVALSGATPTMEGEDARLRELLSKLKDMSNEITDWIGDQQPEATHIMAANFIVETASQTLECAEIALASTDTLIADLGLMMPSWRAGKDNILERAKGPEWVLDGWKTPIALWKSADANQRRAAIWEIALLAPILPREAKAWLGKVSDWRETPRRITQVVRDKADWRSGSVMEIVARNENLIGASISYENRITPMIMPRGKTRLSRQRDGAAINTNQIITKSKLDGKTPERQVEAGITRNQAVKGSVSVTSRVLGGQIQVASDAALEKIVMLVDRLANPEIHERLLGPSLRRLKRLRPPRPASLMRLLFLPISGALIDAPQWRRSDGRVPRSALGPLLQSLSRVIGPQTEAISIQLRGGSLDDIKLVDRCGRQLWNLAADAAPRLSLSPSWASVGLSEQDFDAVRNLAGALWRHAGPLWDGMQQVGGVFSAAVETLLQRAARPSNFLSLIRDLPTQVSGMIEDALNLWVGASLTEIAEDDFATGARLAREIGVIIVALEEQPKITAKIDARELVSHRRNLELFCRSSYREVVSVHVTKALLELAPDHSVELGEIEAMARVARSLEETGKRFGPPQSYAALQDEFRAQMEKLRQNDANAAVTPMEIARIEEILIGQEEAEFFLRRPRRRGAQGR